MDAEVLAFVSGKGGTGKSTLSVYIGGALGELGKRVLLIELDSGLRSVDIIAGVSGQTVYDIEDVLTGRIRPAKAVVQSRLYRGLSLISAPYAGGTIPAPALRVLCQRLAPFFDVILLDTAAGLGEAFRSAAEVASQAVLVLTADPVALRDGRVVSDELEGKVPRMRMLLNKVDAERIQKDNTLRDLDEAIDTVGVQLLGIVPHSPAVYAASTTGRPLPTNAKERQIFRAIARRLLGEDVPLLYP